MPIENVKYNTLIGASRNPVSVLKIKVTTLITFSQGHWQSLK